MRESVVTGEFLTTHIPTDENHEDLLKGVLYGRKWGYHMSNLIYNIYNYQIL